MGKKGRDKHYMRGDKKHHGYWVGAVDEKAGGRYVGAVRAIVKGMW